MESQDSGRVNDVLGFGGQGWKCPFSFCPRFGAQLRGSSALRDHISSHLRSSRSECLSGRGLGELVQHLREHGRWLCGRCFKTYRVGYRCRNRDCGAIFMGSEGLPICMPPGVGMPVLTNESDMLLGPVVPDEIADIFKPFDEDPEIFKKLRCAAIPTMSFIPKSCRRRVARCYAEAVKAVNEVPDDLNRWGIMHIFVVSVLRSVGKEARGGVSLSALVAQRLVEWEGGGEGQRRLWVEAVSKGTSRERAFGFGAEDQRKMNVKRCEKLATFGRLGDAARALVSGGVLSQSQGVLDELGRKHPFAQPPVARGDRPSCLLVPSWEDVLRALRSFPRGSAGGRDGLRAQLLLDMVQGVAGRLEEVLVQGAFTAHVALLLGGRAPTLLAPFLMSAPLIPLAKSGGGVRPIAVGEVWRRLTSRVALASVSASARDFLLPFQFGVGVKGGAEAITHSLNHLVAKYSSEEGLGILKVDLTNAFNLVSRAAFLDGVRQHFPSLSSWVEYCYGCQALLFVGESVLLGCCGVQQGDPLGPLLFAIALQPLVCRIGELCPRLMLNAWYLDDGILMGRKEDLLAAFNVIQELGPQLGLVVNHSKSVWWWPSGGERPGGLPDGVVVSASSALRVLGSPISVNGEGADEVVEERVRDIQNILVQMSMLDNPQLELLLLRACVGMPKMMYNLRSAPPCWIERSIRSFDDAVHQSLVHIYNSGFTREQRRLVGLPLKFGGLGIPMASEVALSAALASLVQVGDLWEMITRDSFSSSKSRFLLEEWNMRFRPTSPVGLEKLRSMAKPQQWLTGLAADCIKEEIQAHGGARLDMLVSAVSASGSGVWTTAVPTPFSGLHMNPAAYRLALKYRTGHDVFAASRPCTACRGLQTSDASGDHDSHCPGGGRRIRRHNAVRDVLFSFFREANLGPRLEVAGLLDGGEKPADILVPAWDDGRDLCVDVSIVSPFVGGGAVLGSGVAARRAEERKMSRYEAGCSANGLIFEPFIMDSLGGFGRIAERLLRTLAARWAEVMDFEPPAALSILRQKLSFVSQKALADGFLLRTDYG